MRPSLLEVNGCMVWEVWPFGDSLNLSDLGLGWGVWVRVNVYLRNCVPIILIGNLCSFATLLLLLPGSGKLDKDLSTVNESQECAKCHTVSLTYKICKDKLFLFCGGHVGFTEFTQPRSLGLLSMSLKDCLVTECYCLLSL